VFEKPGCGVEREKREREEAVGLALYVAPVCPSRSLCQSQKVYLTAELIGFVDVLTFDTLDRYQIRGILAALAMEYCVGLRAPGIMKYDSARAVETSQVMYSPS